MPMIPLPFAVLLVFVSGLLIGWSAKAIAVDCARYLRGFGKALDRLRPGDE